MKDRFAGAGEAAIALAVDNGDGTPGTGDLGDNDEEQDDDQDAPEEDEAATAAGGKAATVDDDPLQCTARALLAAMPRKMRALRLELAAAAAASPFPPTGGELDVGRVWTTMCVIALLESINVCWLATDGEEYPEEERTIVDAAREWLEAQAKEHFELKSVLSDGAAAAARAVLLWHRAWLCRVGEVRRSEAVLAHVGTSHAHRAGGELLRALVTRHDTCRVFLSEPLDGLQRWQMWCLVVSAVLTQLLTSIWMCVRVRRVPVRVTCMT